MRAYGLFLILAAGLLFPACNREPRRDDPSARQVGRDAYHATQELKRDAKKAGQEIRQAGKDIREGWNQAKREDKTRPKK